MAFTRAEYSVPSLVWLILFLAWLRFPNHHWAARLLLGWGAISLAGAILTVLPSSFLAVPAGAVLAPLRSSRALCGNAATGSSVDMEDALFSARRANDPKVVPGRRRRRGRAPCGLLLVNPGSGN